jgi:transposase
MRRLEAKMAKYGHSRGDTWFIGTRRNLMQYRQLRSYLEERFCQSIEIVLVILAFNRLVEKKYRQFVAVLIDHTNRRVLDVLENRDKVSVLAYLEAGKASGLLAQLEEVTTDMWDGYVVAVKEVFGETVRVTIDRFHVMKNFQDHLTDARRQIQRELTKEEAQALKGTRWLG